eukprot:1157924-Pelagomonas_calceolata.AAC.6
MPVNDAHVSLQEAARLKQLADAASEMQAAAQKASEAAAKDRKAAEAARKALGSIKACQESCEVKALGGQLLLWLLDTLVCSQLVHAGAEQHRGISRFHEVKALDGWLLRWLLHQAHAVVCIQLAHAGAEQHCGITGVSGYQSPGWLAFLVAAESSVPGIARSQGPGGLAHSAAADGRTEGTCCSRRKWWGRRLSQEHRQLHQQCEGCAGWQQSAVGRPGGCGPGAARNRGPAGEWLQRRGVAAGECLLLRQVVAGEWLLLKRVVTSEWLLPNGAAAREWLLESGCCPKRGVTAAKEGVYREARTSAIEWLWQTALAGEIYAGRTALVWRQRPRAALQQKGAVVDRRMEVTPAGG